MILCLLKEYYTSFKAWLFFCKDMYYNKIMFILVYVHALHFTVGIGRLSDITVCKGCLSIITSWDPVSSHPVCEPLSYDVTISPSDGVMMMRITDTSYNFTGLTLNTYYTVTVAGRNNAGVGESVSVTVNSSTIANVVPHGK